MYDIIDCPLQFGLHYSELYSVDQQDRSVVFVCIHVNSEDGHNYMEIIIIIIKKCKNWVALGPMSRLGYFRPTISVFYSQPSRSQNLIEKTCPLPFLFVYINSNN